MYGESEANADALIYVNQYFNLNDDSLGNDANHGSPFGDISNILCDIRAKSRDFDLLNCINQGEDTSDIDNSFSLTHALISPSGEIVRQDISLTTSTKEKLGIHFDTASQLSAKQLAKDMERDQVIINGYLVFGSLRKLNGIISVMRNFLQQLSTEYFSHDLTDQQSQIISETILRYASRTHSGSIILQVVKSIIDTDVVNIIPVSSLARPINLSLSLKPNLRIDGQVKGKLKCKCVCSFIFKIEKVNIEEENQTKVVRENPLHVEATYEDVLVFNDHDLRSPTSESRKVLIHEFTP